jgi:very-short-patch-repair endonuclease
MRAPKATQDRARVLRSSLSLPEKLLWVRLRRRDPGLPRFRRQHPVGPFVLDFYCSDAKLCIEVDGQSHGTGDRPARDARRDDYLRAQGIQIVRIAAASVLEDPESTTDWIREMAGQREIPDV